MRTKVKDVTIIIKSSYKVTPGDSVISYPLHHSPNRLHTAPEDSIQHAARGTGTKSFSLARMIYRYLSIHTPHTSSRSEHYFHNFIVLYDRSIILASCFYHIITKP